jgi:hypothetical protein
MPRSVLAAILGLLIAALSLAGTPAQAQVEVFTIKSVDAALADLRYLARCAGQSPKFVDDSLQTLIGGKGLKGVDTRAPLGLYGDDPATLVFFIPITDAKQFLELLKQSGVKVAPTRLKEVYDVTVLPFGSARLRFAHQYAFISADQNFLKAELLNPRLLVPEDRKDSLVTYTHRVDRLGSAQRKQIYESLEEAFKASKEFLPRESYSQYLARLVQTKKQKDFMRSVFDEIREFSAHLQIDQKQHLLVLEAALVPQPKTRLVERLRSLATVKSSFHRLGEGGGLRLTGHLPLAEEFPLDGSGIALEELMWCALPSDRARLRRIGKVLEPILTPDRLDCGAALYPDGHFVAGLTIRDGRKTEHQVRDLVKDLSTADKSEFSLKWNHSRVGNARLHRLTVATDPESHVAEPLKGPVGPAFAFVGQGPLPLLSVLHVKAEPRRALYFCLREEVLLVSSNPKLIQQALDDLGKPPLEGPTFRLELTGHAIAWLSRELGPILEADKDTAKIAKPVVAALEKGWHKLDRDKVHLRLSLRGGATLRLRLELSTDLLQIVPALEELGRKLK